MRRKMVLSGKLKNLKGSLKQQCNELKASKSKQRRSFLKRRNSVKPHRIVKTAGKPPCSVALSWIPISFVVTGPGMAIAEKKTAEATQLEARANEELRKSEHELEKRESQNEKAKVLIILHL